MREFTLESSRGLTLRLRESRFFDLERILGLSAPYPLAGWASWCARHGDAMAILSASFTGGKLRAVEWYLARNPTPLHPTEIGDLRLEPGGVRLADGVSRLAPAFSAFAGEGPVYDRTLCATCDDGLAFCMVLAERIVRIALYAS